MISLIHRPLFRLALLLAVLVAFGLVIFLRTPSQVQAHQLKSFGQEKVGASAIVTASQNSDDPYLVSVILTKAWTGEDLKLRVYRNFGDYQHGGLNEDEKIYEGGGLTLLDEDPDKNDGTYTTTLDFSGSDFNPRGELGKEYHIVVYVANLKINNSEASIFLVSGGGPSSNIVVNIGELSDDGKTLSSITVSALQTDKVYMFKLNGPGDWNGWLREKDGRGLEFNSRTSRSVTVSNICENGEGNRNDCGEEFRNGNYLITVWDVANNKPLKSHKFTVGGKEVNPLVKVPGLATGSSKSVNEVASGFASTFLSFGIGIAGGIAFLLMVFGAYRLIFAGGNPDAMQQGKEIITAAIAGLLVIIFAMFILRFLGFTIFGIF